MHSDSNSLQIPLSHFRQRYSWDCGLSCVIMIIPLDKRVYLLDNFHRICEDSGFNKCTWTIDLCYLLKRFEVDHIYYTLTLGVNPTFRRNQFYYKMFNKNEQRVNQLFECASENGLVVEKCSLKMEDLIMHLKMHGPIIVLINANYLICDDCSRYNVIKYIISCFPWLVPYYGHYIVICGFSLSEEKVFYRDPSCRDRVCRISFDDMTRARQSYGTDEDVILVFNK